MEKERNESSGSADEPLQSSKNVDEVNSATTSPAAGEDPETKANHTGASSTEGEQQLILDDLISKEESEGDGMDSIERSGASTETASPDSQTQAELGQILPHLPGAPHGYPEEVNYHAQQHGGFYPVPGHPTHPTWPISDRSSFLPRSLYDPSHIPHQYTDRTEINNQQQHQAEPTQIPINRNPNFPSPMVYPQMPGYSHPQYQFPGPYDSRFRVMIPPGHPHTSDANTQQSYSSHSSSSREQYGTVAGGDHEHPPSQPHHAQSYSLSATAQAAYYRQHAQSQPSQRDPYDQRSTSSSPYDNDQYNSQVEPIPNPRRVRARQNCSGRKRYQCSICLMGFERPSNLKVHHRRHSGERPFVCDVCGKDFTTASNTTRHRRQLHRHLYEQEQSASTTSPPAEGRSVRTRAETHSLRMQGGMDFTYQRQPPPRDQSHSRSIDQSQPSTISGPSGNERDDQDDRERRLQRRRRRTREDI